ILEIVKQKLEYENGRNGGSQWIVGVSMKEISNKDGPTYIVRAAVRNNETSFVEGFEMIFLASEYDVIIEASRVKVMTAMVRRRHVISRRANASLNWLDS